MSDSRLKSLKDWLIALFTSGSGGIHFWDVEYVPTDIDKTSAALKVEALAEQSGSKGLPRFDAREPDFGHKRLFAHFAQKLQQLHANATARLAHYNNSSDIEQLSRIGQRAALAPEEFQRTVEQSIERFSDQVKEQVGAIASAQRELDQFKAANGLARDPDRPHRLGIFICLPIFLLAVDVSLNAYVFKDAAPEGGGWKGGITTAFFLAAFNVVLAMLFGYLLRNKNAANLLHRIFGWLMGVVLAMYIPFNLFVAHLRDRILQHRAQMEGLSFDQIVIQRDQLFADAVTHLWQSPFSFTGIESAALFVLGSVFAYLAAADGYQITERVPGFARLYDRAADLQVGLQKIRQEFRDEVSDAYERINSELSNSARAVDESEGSIRNYLTMRKKLLSVFDQQSRDYVASYDALVARYRELNLAARGGNPAPTYFNEPAARLRPPELQIEPLAEGADYAGYADKAAQTRQAIADAQRDVHVRWARLQAQIVDLDDRGSARK